MKRAAIFILIVLGLSGCARFRTVQTDVSYDNAKTPTREITTKVTAYTFFTASSELTKFRATNTDKTQSASVGSLGQESTGTNLLNAISAGIGTALKVYTGTP